MSADDQSLWERILAFFRIAFETWKFFVSLITLIIALGITSGILGTIKSNATFLIWGFIIVAVFIPLGLIVSFFANKHSSKNKVRVFRKYVTYRYFPDLKTMEHTKDYHLISLIDGLDTFVDRYKWSCTKQGRIDVSLLSEHQTLTQRQDADWSLNVIKFNPPLHKADTTHIQLRWDLFCEGTLSHFLSQLIEYPTDRLTLSVSLPYEPCNIRFIDFNSGEGIETDPGSVDHVFHLGENQDCNYYRATREIRYDIDKPKMKHKYAIKWDPPAVL